MAAEDEVNPRGEEVPVEVRERLMEAYAASYMLYHQAIEEIGLSASEAPEDTERGARRMGVEAFDRQIGQEFDHGNLSSQHMETVSALRDETELLDPSAMALILSRAEERRQERVVPFLQRYVAHCVELAQEEPDWGRSPERIPESVREHAEMLMDSTLAWMAQEGRIDDMDLLVVRSIIHGQPYEEIVRAAGGVTSPADTKAAVIAMQEMEILQLKTDKAALLQVLQEQERDLSARNVTIEQQKSELDALRRSVINPQITTTEQSGPVDPAVRDAVQKFRQSGGQASGDFPPNVRPDRPPDHGK